MEPSEADRLHHGLIRSFAEFFSGIEDARVAARAGYRVVVCPRVPVAGLNGIWADGPDEAASLDEFEGAIEDFERGGSPCWIVVRVSRAPAMEHRARRLGFTDEESLPAMVATRNELAHAPGPDVEIRRVRDETGLDAAATVAAAGFEAPRELLSAMFTSRVAGLPGESIYVAYADGTPVSTATAWLGDGGIGIFNVATPPEYRNRGYGRAVTARAVQDGFAAGADLAWLQASPLGEPVYRAMGFRQVDTYMVLGRPTPS